MRNQFLSENYAALRFIITRSAHPTSNSTTPSTPNTIAPSYARHAVAMTAPADHPRDTAPAPSLLQETQSPPHPPPPAPSPTRRSADRNRNRGVYTTPPSFANPETFSVIVAIALTRVRAKFHECTANPAAIASNTNPTIGSTPASGGATRSKPLRNHRKNSIAPL